ncbi:hypothetical protein ACFOEY_07060 [Paracandidimonas soli]|uniref:hypothetical protein n=1 Tax=Paracandidimonas soli TaxID=1917182 RepID=UPI00361189F3
MNRQRTDAHAGARTHQQHAAPPFVFAPPAPGSADVCQALYQQRQAMRIIQVGDLPDASAQCRNRAMRLPIAAHGGQGNIRTGFLQGACRGCRLAAGRIAVFVLEIQQHDIGRLIPYAGANAGGIQAVTNQHRRIAQALLKARRGRRTVRSQQDSDALMRET